MGFIIHLILYAILVAGLAICVQHIYALHKRERVARFNNEGSREYSQEVAREQKALEELVNERTKQLKKLADYNDSIVQNLPLALIIVDKHYHLRAVNERFYSLFDVEKKVLLGKHICEAIGCDDDAPEVECAVRKELAAMSQEKSNVRETDLVVLRKEKEIIYHLYFSCMPTNDILIVAEDITKNRMLEQKLLSSERLALVAKLAASVAHEINNPLQAIITHLSLVQETLPDNQKENKSFQFIKRGVYRIRDIVRELLDIYKGDGEEKSILNVNGLLQEVYELTRHQIQLRGIRCEMQLCKEKVTLSGYRHQLHQLFLNIIFNILDSSAKQSVITIRSIDEGDVVRIIMSGSESILSANTASNVFDPEHSIRERDGVGLGLFVCEGLVKNHNGTIGFSSDSSQGISFHIELPK